MMITGKVLSYHNNVPVSHNCVLPSNGAQDIIFHSEMCWSLCVKKQLLEILKVLLHCVKCIARASVIICFPQR